MEAEVISIVVLPQFLNALMLRSILCTSHRSDPWGKRGLHLFIGDSADRSIFWQKRDVLQLIEIAEDRYFAEPGDAGDKYKMQVPVLRLENAEKFPKKVSVPDFQLRVDSDIREKRVIIFVNQNDDGQTCLFKDSTQQVREAHGEIIAGARQQMIFFLVDGQGIVQNARKSML